MLMELGVFVLGSVQIACLVASNILGKHLFEMLVDCVFLDLGV